MSRKPLAALLMLALASCGREPQRVPVDHSAHQAAASAGAQSAHAGHAPHDMAEVVVADDRRQLLGVRTVEIGVRPLVREIRTVGVVSADERRVRRIQSRVSGWVEQLFVTYTGERVRIGQPFLAVYSPELFASQREFVLSLSASDAAKDSQPRTALLEAARARLQQFGMSDAQIEALAESRDPQRRVVLHSPSDGYVTLKSVLEGSFIEPEMELYTVSELTRVWVWAELSEDEIPLIALGQRARIDLPAAPGEREAAVAFLQPTLSSETRTLRVRFDLDNADGALRPGMYATVRIERPLGEVLALPDEAVIDTGVRRVVFVEVEPGHFQPRTVRLGRSGESHYEVLEGLTAGERVVVSAQFLLDSESRLRAAGGPAHGAH
jgi:Cu(I)/Ag(I) efflux system membrane fusion protein